MSGNVSSRRGGRRSLTLDDAESIEVTNVDELVGWIQESPETAWKLLCNRMKYIEDLKAQIATGSR